MTDERSRDEGAADERIPCSDEMCTGTIGGNGRCNYCGRSARGAPAVAVVESASPEGVPADDDERIPCFDDLCTGTVNARGSCNYCGRVHPGVRRK